MSQFGRTLPPGFAASCSFVGDSITLGLGDNNMAGAYPATPGFAIGNNQTGGFRQSMLQAFWAMGVPVPTYPFWFRGTNVPSPYSPGMPGGAIHHQGQSGMSAATMATNFATYWSTAPAASVFFAMGTNDIRTWQLANPGDDAGAATAAVAGIGAALDAIRATAPAAPVCVASPPAGDLVAIAVDLLLPQLRALVATKRAAGMKVYFGCDWTTYIRESNGAAGVGTNTDMITGDHIHPTVHGYQAMGGMAAQGILASPY